MPSSPPAFEDDAAPTARRTRDAPVAFAAPASAARGRVPNVFWRAVSADDLRAEARFVALPEVADVALGGRRSFAYVRQGTELWDALHDGRCTTGLLLGALGFSEDGVDRRALGFGSRGRGSGATIAACRRLRRAKVGEDEVDAEEEAEAQRRNDEAVADFNRSLSISNDASASEDEPNGDVYAVEAAPVLSTEASAMDIMLASLSLKPTSHQPKQKHKSKGAKGKSKKKKKRSSKPNRAKADDGTMLTNAQYCRAVAKGGELAVRLAWGSAQESSTLCSLMMHFKDSIVHEAGLCMLDPDLIPTEWQIGLLPPIGASPDGLITMANGERFVLEIKNSSPFREVPGGYIISDREPYEKPPGYHMPQVQLEMLCTGTRSALLAMQNMTYGIRVYRVDRCDDFIAGMLRRISRLYTSFVTPFEARDPPSNWEVQTPAHKSLVRTAARLARESTLFCHIRTGLVPDSIEVDEDAFVACGT